MYGPRTNEQNIFVLFYSFISIFGLRAILNPGFTYLIESVESESRIFLLREDVKSDSEFRNKDRQRKDRERGSIGQVRHRPAQPEVDQAHSGIAFDFVG